MIYSLKFGGVIYFEVYTINLFWSANSILS